MATARSHGDAVEQDGGPIPQPAEDVAAEPSPAWEQVENGRYRPRRIRGSFRGRELG
jgi:hypothetical protein